MTREVINSNPDAYIEFYTYKHEDARSIDPDSNSDLGRSTLVQVYSDILSLNFSKPKGGLGSWSAVLASSSNYKGLLHPGAWALIYCRNWPYSRDKQALKALSNTQEDGFRMLGIVRSVRMDEQVDPNTGTKTVRYIVSGDDFHKIFNSNIYMLPQGSDQIQGKNSLASTNWLFGSKEASTLRTVRDTVATLFSSLVGQFGREIKYGSVIEADTYNSNVFGNALFMPNGLLKKLTGLSGNQAGKCITYFGQSNLIGQISIIADYGGQNINVWEYMSAYANLAINELYTELLPINYNGTTKLVPALVLRAIPFSPHKSKLPHAQCIRMVSAVDKSIKIPGQRPKLTLPPLTASSFYISKKIKESEILSFNSGKSDAEAFNFFHLTSDMLSHGKMAETSWLQTLIGSKATEIMVPQTIKRFGLKVYAKTVISNIDIDSVRIMNQIVKQLWQDAYLYENGSVEIVDKDGLHIPVGTNIEFEDRGWIAHVEQVSTSYVVHPNGSKSLRTSIHFSRLQYVDGTVIDIDGGENAQRGEWDRGVNINHPRDLNATELAAVAEATDKIIGQLDAVKAIKLTVFGSDVTPSGKVAKD